MPSNFKKNKRRCKKAQAQKRALEELAAKSPVKATPCISVTVPPKAAQKKVTKTPLPAQEKVQQPTPTAAPIAETPPIEVKAVVKEPVAEPIPVKIEAPGPKALVLEKSSVELQDVKEVPALFAEKTLPEPASVAEAETAKEAEPNIPETKPETEVKPPADVSMETSAATEIHTTKTTIVTTETEQEAVVQSIESPEVPFTIPVAPAEEPENHVTEDKERPANKDIADSLVDDFVVTESASAVEVAISECAAIKPEIVEVSNVLGSQSDSTALLPTENAPAAAPAEEMVIQVTPEQKCAEEPKPEICDMPCQTQQAVESVEMLAETSVNGHVVQVSIES
ncbi:calphotin-like isoform X4 [Antennarius striatus]|uniref:calphotin-like isoform X4 n=1 Tax=Antennarius striatus TaxID=241820 RepID=UPI0035AED0DD